MSSTMIIRPVRKKDLDALEALALQAGPGMTNLPPIRSILSEKIQFSTDSLHPEYFDVDKGVYFFVLEDVSTHHVAGCSAIMGRANSESPMYHFKVNNEVLYCKQLQITKEHQVLYMVNDYQHTTEVCSLFVAPEYRHSHNGTLISRSRFLFMSEFPNRFAHKIIAELRGFVDQNNESPFWKGFAQYFLPIDYSHTDLLSGSGQKQFIRDLLPQVPVFATLLHPDTQAAMGMIQEATQPAYNLLRKEGFEFNNYIDIFDGGPTLEAHFHNINTITKNHRATVKKIAPAIQSKILQLMSNTSLDFRACQGCVEIINENEVIIDSDTAQLLHVKVGDIIRFTAIHI